MLQHVYPSIYGENSNGSDSEIDDSVKRYMTFVTGLKGGVYFFFYYNAQNCFMYYKIIFHLSGQSQCEIKLSPHQGTVKRGLYVGETLECSV